MLKEIPQHLIPQQVVKLCQILRDNGYQAFIVGGCVRDLLMETVPKDYDITTDAMPEKVMEIFPKNIPTGLQHGTVTVVMGEGVENHFEVTTFRTEGKYLDGRHPESVSFVNDIKEDLARRDFAMNAIAFDPIKKEMVDPFDGVTCITHRIVDAVGNPVERFQEDGLRIMRAARFVARLGWSITARTEDGMKASIDTLKKVSKERISDELAKTLMAAYPADGIRLLMECGALDVACPLLAGRQLPHIDFPTSREHPKDFPNGELETRLAFLYSKIDITKVEKELFELKFSNKEIKKTLFLLRALDFFFIAKIRVENSPQPELAYRHFIALFKNEAPGTWDDTLREFIMLAELLETPVQNMLDKYRGQIVHSRKEMQINGNDLMELGIKPGPQIKTILDKCYLNVLRYPECNNKEALMIIARDTCTTLINTM